MLESGIRWVVRKITGSKRGNDYCWSGLTSSQPLPPWYLQRLVQAPDTAPPPPASNDPAPQDSDEVKALGPKP
ncbi:MAG: hypothetical protein IPP14_03830 [Planctomycetes bacterium]|nr:hypothetical protein [Planctomycetota bacterium]